MTVTKRPRPSLPVVAGETEKDVASSSLTAAQQRQRQDAGRKHGLYAHSARENRKRAYRVGRLLQVVRQVVTIQPRDEWAARAFCQLEVLATDAFNGLLEDPANVKLSERFTSYRRHQLLYARELGLTPAARAQVSRQAIGLAEQLAQLEGEQ